MNTLLDTSNRTSAGIARSALLAIVGALAVSAATAADIKVTLSGDQEIPAVATAAKGAGVITIAEDKSVSGSVKTTGVEGIAAHIHLGEPGKNGPPIITLTRSEDNVWSTPPGAKLSDEQYAAFQAGHLYVNVHSAQNKGGEIRGQLKP